MDGNTNKTVVTSSMILDGLKSHLSKLRKATTAFTSAPTESLTWLASDSLKDAFDLLIQSGERLRDTSTKFSLVLSNSPKAPSIKSISDEMRSSCDSLVAALGVLVGPQCGAGPPLLELYCQQVRSILRATEELVRLIVTLQGLPTAAEKESVAPRTGVVWSTCEQLAKLPRSNKVAYRRSFLQHQSAVRDTLREFHQMLEAGGNEPEEEECIDADDEGLSSAMENLDVDDDFFGGDLSLQDWEKYNTEKSLCALDHCSNLIKALLAAIDEVTQVEDSGGKIVMQAISRVEESCQGLAAAVVNVADALYPPQIPEELEAHLGGLLTAIDVLVESLNTLPNGPAVVSCHEEAERVKVSAKAFQISWPGE